MIIFDLDGTLADREHRLHFVDPYKNPTYEFFPKNNDLGWKEGWYCNLSYSPHFGMPWKPDFKSFYEACDQDTPIKSVCRLFEELDFNNEIQIWSARCESVRDKTKQWLCENTAYIDHKLKMRPIGDFTPDEQLKEKWLEETYQETKWGRRTPIEMVFDDRPKVIRMWRSHGIFVFDCNQTGKEF